MKNIHIIPTDEQIKNVGDLVKDKYGDIHIFTKNDGKEYGKTTTKLNIYITSDEEIKEGDWYLYGSQLVKANGLVGFHPTIVDSCKKIILTTDQDLIKDGVQAIDDEFLEWFVKNPSCEFVKIKNKILKVPNRFNDDYRAIPYFKIIIPKEELKPHSFCETPEEKCTMNYCDENGCQNRKRILVEEPKQETLEEAAELYKKLYEFRIKREQIQRKEGFIDGAKLNQERSYTLEEISKDFVGEGRSGGYFDDYLDYRINNPRMQITFKEWFKNFKE